jgi:hypothetical protein
MFKRLKVMKVIVHILTNLAICMNIPMICDFDFVYCHGYYKFGCLTKVLLVCLILKPPTIWQLRKYRLRRWRKSLLSSRMAQEHIRVYLFSQLFEKIIRSSDIVNCSVFWTIFKIEEK